MKKFKGVFIFSLFIFVPRRNDESKRKLKGGEIILDEKMGISGEAEVEIKISFPEEEAGDGHFRRVEGLKVEGYQSSYWISRLFEKIGGNLAIAKQLKGNTENKPEMSNTKKTESFKYRVYNLVFCLLQTRIKS